MCVTFPPTAGWGSKKEILHHGPLIRVITRVINCSRNILRLVGVITGGRSQQIGQPDLLSQCVCCAYVYVRACVCFSSVGVRAVPTVVPAYVLTSRGETPLALMAFEGVTCKRLQLQTPPSDHASMERVGQCTEAIRRAPAAPISARTAVYVCQRVCA